LAERKKGGGSKLFRTELVSVRIDPKLRFAVELAARKQRRTASSFVEWAIEEAIKRLPLRINAIKGKGDVPEEISLPGDFPLGCVLNTYSSSALANGISRRRPCMRLLGRFGIPRSRAGSFSWRPGIRSYSRMTKKFYGISSLRLLNYGAPISTGRGRLFTRNSRLVGNS
jgi:hypothetical protein